MEWSGVYACIGARRFCKEEAPTGPRNYKGSLAHAQQDACAVAAQQVRELDMYAGAWRLRPWKKQQLGLAVTLTHAQQDACAGAFQQGELVMIGS